MIISRITGGTGNQLFQYATGRRLAYKLNTELKLDLTIYDKRKVHPYGLDQFNIKATVATQEEIKFCKEFSAKNGLGVQKNSSLQEVLNYPDNVYLQGYWGLRYFADIADIIRSDLTLKNPLSLNAEIWKQKILSSECSVSMHFRHGDYVYNPFYKDNRIWADIPPLDVYCNCLNVLKQVYKNITVFVFSNNLQYLKENLHLDVPIEFVEGNAHDVEELYLMSLCKHNIIPMSTFSWWAAWLNQNLDKKVFQLRSAETKEVESYHYSLIHHKQNSNLNSVEFTIVPFDKNKRLENITMRPIFSLLLVVNNDAKNLPATLDSLLGQDYKFYEVIIIDNASTDGSDKICQDAVKDKKNATLKRLESKVNNATSWNIAFKAAQGKYVLFLKVGDRFLINSLTRLYFITEGKIKDNIIHMFAWLEEDKNGDVTFDGKKFSAQRDSKFKEEKGKLVMSKDGSDATKLLLNHQINTFLGTNLLQINTFLGTKLYNYEFLTEHKIKFDESLSNEVTEIFFQIEAFLSSKYFMYIPKACYIPPVKA